MFIGLELLHTWLASSNTISYPLVLTDRLEEASEVMRKRDDNKKNHIIS